MPNVKTEKKKLGVTDQLIENNIELQKKAAELISSVNLLVKKLDTMVNIFQDAAKHIKTGEDEPLMKKLEDLIEQNRNIARGLILLERYVREKGTVPSFSSPPKPLPSANF